MKKVSQKVTLILLFLLFLITGYIPIVHAQLNSGLVAYYPFTGNFSDISGNSNHGTANSITMVNDRFSISNRAVSFNGASSYIDVSSLPLLQSFSISIWVKVDTLTMPGILFGADGSWIMGMNPMRMSSGNTKAGSACGSAWATSSGSIYPTIKSEWNHITWIRESSGYERYYLNGVLQSYQYTNNFSIPSCGFGTFIGAVRDWAYNFNSYFMGSIDEIRLYNRSLTEQEVMQLYYFNAPPKILVDPQHQQKPIGDAVTLHVETFGDSLTYSWQRNGVTLSPDVNNDSLIFTTISITDTGNYRCIISNSHGSDTSQYAHLNIITLDSGLVVYYPFTGNAIDSSGHGNNGVVSGATLTYDNHGNPNKAFYFDGVNDNITTTHSNDIDFSGTNDFSINLWINVDSFKNGFTVFDKIPNVGFTYDLGIYLHISNNGMLCYQLGNEGMAWDPCTSPEFITTHQWYQFVAVKRGNYSELYMNGELLGTEFLMYSQTAIKCTADMVLGYMRRTNSDFFNGTLDQVRIYNRALSPYEVQKLYNIDRVFPPVITTNPSVTNRTTVSAIVSGNITSTGTDTVKTRGICYVEYMSETDPTIFDSIRYDSGNFSTGSFSKTLTNLNPATRYRVSAYATNRGGTAYGDYINFSTMAEEPDSHSTYLYTSYSLYTEGYDPNTYFEFDFANTIGASGYILLERYGTPPTSLPVDGVDYIYQDSIGDAKIVGIVDFVYDGYTFNNSLWRNNYTQCGLYYYKLIPFNWGLYMYESFNYLTQDTIPADTVLVYFLPETASNPPVLVKDSSVIASGNVISNGCTPITERGFIYTSYNQYWYPDYYYDNYVSKTGSFSAGTFTDTIPWLYPATPYNYASFAINAADIVYGDIKTFWTLANEPYQHAGTFTASSSSQLQRIYLNFTDPYTTGCSGYIILQKKDSPPTGLPLDGTQYNPGDSIGDSKIATIIYDDWRTSDSLSNIVPGHVYYFKLIPYNWDWMNVPTYNYRTKPTIPSANTVISAPPTVDINYTVTNISSSGATVEGEIINTGAANPTIRGMCYHDTLSFPTISDSVRFQTGSFGTGVYQINLTNLLPETQYTYRAYATNVSGNGYSNDKNSFRTLSAEPSSYPASFTATTNSTTQIKLNFSAPSSITNCDGYFIVMRQDTVPVSVPFDGYTQTVGATNGVEVLCAIITNTSATTSMIGNLNPGSRYYFSIFPFNWDGVNIETYNYRTQATIPVTNAYTIVPSNVTTTQPATVNSSTSADVSGNITYLGSDSVATKRGICFKIFAAGDPTISDSTNFESGTFGLGGFTRSLTALTAETHYKSRAYAINLAGPGYGNSVDFWTYSSEPVTMPASFTATTFTTTQINLGFSLPGTITNCDGYLILMRQGSSPSSSPSDGKAYSVGTILGDAVVAAIVNNTATSSISVGNLNPGQTYYFSIFPFNWNQSNTETFNYYISAPLTANALTILIPTVSTSPVPSNISSSAADWGGTITDNGGASIGTRGFAYKIFSAGDPALTDSLLTESGSFGTGNYSKTASLLAETRYKYIAYATNPAGNGFGSSYDFYTLSLEPGSAPASFTATTYSATQINLAFSAASTITNADGYLVIMNTVTPPSSLPVDGNGYSVNSSIGDATVAAIINNSGSTNASINNLTPNTDYHFKIIPYNWNGSNQQTYNYKTSPTILSANDTTVVAPTVVTNATIDSITSTLVWATGNITATGGSDAIKRGFCYKVYAAGDPTIANMATLENGTFGTGVYSLNIGILNTETRYKIRAFATNSAGTGYGNTYDFYTLASEPQNHAAGFSATTISTTQIDLSFSAASTLTNADGYIVLIRQSASPTTYPVDGQGYSQGNTLGNGTVAAIITNTATTSLSLYNLTPGENYYFLLIPYNWDQTNTPTYNYYVQPTIPNANAKTMLPPTVTTSSVIDSITSSTAQVSGNITSTGAVNPTQRGICYKVYSTGDPDTSNTKSFNTGSFGTGSYVKTLSLSPQTRYKARAYASNIIGTGYGSTYDFYTFSAEPSANPVFFNATASTQYSIRLGFSAFAAISDCDGYLILMSSNGTPNSYPVDGNTYSVNSTIGNASVAVYVLNSADTFTNIYNLSPATTYHFTIIPFNWDGTYALTYNYKTNGPPLNASALTVVAPVLSTNQTVTNISANGADLSGSITDNGGQNLSKRGFVYKVFTTGDPTISDSVNVQTGSFGTGVFNRTLTGLLAETHYKYLAYAYRGADNYYGPVSYDFYTYSSEPAAHAAKFNAATISTTEINLTFSAAGTITNADGYIILMRQGAAPSTDPSDGIMYGNNSTIGNATVAGIINSNSDTTLSVMNLSPGKTYHFSLYPFNWDGSITQTYNYRTAATVPSANAATIVHPTLLTSASISNITSDSASINGDITSTGGENPNTRGICYKIYSSGDPTTSNSVNSEAGSFGTGIYTRILSGLSPETRYKLRAYAINSSGTGYAANSVDFYTLSAEPVAHSTVFTATTASTSQINLAFDPASTITNADGYIILMKQGAAISGLPLDGISYTVGNTIGDATVCAIINSTTITTANVTAVSPNNTYYFKLIPFNSDGSNASTHNYRTRATIPASNATTLVLPTVVTSNTVSSITNFSAGLSGDITDPGGVNATNRGICYIVYSAVIDPTKADFISQQSGSFGISSFTRTLNGLNPETHYKARAYATNILGTGYGLSIDFYTLSNPPQSHATTFTATTSSTSQIDLTFSPASSITNADGYIIIQRQGSAPTGLPFDGQSYTIGSPIGNGTVAAIITDNAGTEAAITSVSAGNSYYFTLIPFNWDGTNYQTINYYTSGSIPVANASTITAPLLSTSAAIVNITPAGADISGDITGTGGFKPTVRGICYKVYATSNPIITDSTSKETGSFGTGSFTRNLASLLPETRYKARAYATNTAGTGYGNTVDFFTLSLEPAAHAVLFNAVSYTTSQINLNFDQLSKLPGTNGYIIIQSQGTAPTGLPADGMAFSTGSYIGNGIVAAVINDIYQSSITITNLNAGTTYYYSLIPYKWNYTNPETYNYLTSGTIPKANATTLNPCSINASLRIFGPSIICQNDSIKLEVDTGTGLSYKWTRNNIIIPGATSNAYYASTNGEYKVFINNGYCSVVSLPFNLSNYPVEKPVITSSGSIKPCTNDSVMLSTAYYSAYRWTNGDTNQSTWVNSSGNYFVTVKDQYGCMVESYEFTVNAAATEAPTICIVTVDSILGKNLIVWERPVTALIDSYYIYKESTDAGSYYLIGKTGYADLSVFLDTTSDPRVKADRYRITFIDTCGVESAPSPVHKTMHLTINKGINGENNLIWDHYIGFTFSTYKIYRGSNPGNMRPIALIQNNLSSYSDINPPSGLLFYQVVVVKPDPCYPDILRAQTQSGPYSQSVSNIKDYTINEHDYISAYPSELYIAKEKNSSNVITVYTNMTEDWSVYVTEPWLDAVADKTNHTVVVYANSDNTSETPRGALMVIRSSEVDTFEEVDSTLVSVLQKGTVGIVHNYDQNLNLDVYPNPYTHETNIEYELGKSTVVSVSVYDVFGKAVTQLLNEKQIPGRHKLRFSASELGYPEGIYYLVVIADGKRTVKKLIEMH